ncbi:hypothetical protein [Pontibacter indicus]|uniref:Integral membrane protein n=1 Tax=Pontibacter indicus TaxID=1317125 RepID=A0A1R3XD34_9BACT|nr:hypothetical protein [Pontibacter indicus]SIT89115.1 hypothetical protein SAMN05444128_1965 [Pontibacter indicus]
MVANLNLLSYAIYLPVGVFVTYWVGQKLYINGELYLHQIFSQNPELVAAINKILLTGYYLLNIGYVVILMVQQVPIETTRQLIEVLSSRLGILLVSLGCIHFFNLGALYLISQRNHIQQHT